jgi:hypothetical protein
MRTAGFLPRLVPAYASAPLLNSCGTIATILLLPRLLRTDSSQHSSLYNIHSKAVNSIRHLSPMPRKRFRRSSILKGIRINAIRYTLAG